MLFRTTFKQLATKPRYSLAVPAWCLLSVWNLLLVICYTAIFFSASTHASTPINRSGGGDINNQYPSDAQAKHVVSSTRTISISDTAHQQLEATETLPKIRILFLYIDAVREQYSINTIDQQINELVQQTNLAYYQTGINAIVESAHIGPWPFHNDNEIAAMSAEEVFTDMRDWVDNSLWTEEGLMLRYDADALFLVDNRDHSDNYCGWASIDTVEGIEDYERSNSFGMLRLGEGCGIDASILAHELGHLLGAAHDNIDQNTLKASNPIGYGVVCDAYSDITKEIERKSTIMHDGFPKHVFFSNIEPASSNGEPCGNAETANNALLFGANTALLANKQIQHFPSANVSLSLEVSSNLSGQSAQVTFNRSGFLDETAEIQWHYNNANIQNIDSLLGGSVTFEPGELSKTIKIESPILIDQHNPLYSIYLRNPNRVVSNTNQLSIVMGATIQESVQVNFSVDDLGLHNHSTSPSDIAIANTLWYINDVLFEEEASNFSVDTLEDGIYKIKLVLVDDEGTEHSKTVNIGVESATSADVSRRLLATGNNATSEESSGGSFGFLALVGFSIMGRIRRRSNH